MIKTNITTTKKNKKLKINKNLVDSLVRSVALWRLSSIALSNLWDCGLLWQQLF
jgi:hypothetical protein